MRAFRSRLERGRSGVLSETSEQPATQAAAARIPNSGARAAGEPPVGTMYPLAVFRQAYTKGTTLCKRAGPSCERQSPRRARRRVCAYNGARGGGASARVGELAAVKRVSSQVWWNEPD